MSTERVLTVAQVAERTGLSERTIRAMLADGRLPAVRLAGLRVVRVPEEAVGQLLRAERPAAREAEGAR